MSILSFGFQSDRAPNRCTGPRVEGDWFSLQTPCSRRAFYLNKTMQLSKPIHGLRETFLHEFLQTVIFSGMISENYLEKTCSKKKKPKLIEQFFEVYF